jgi:sulfur carrier protein ThiS
VNEDKDNKISYKIIGAAIEVHKALGPVTDLFETNELKQKYAIIHLNIDILVKSRHSHETT